MSYVHLCLQGRSLENKTSIVLMCCKMLQVYHPNIDLEGNVCLNILRYVKHCKYSACTDFVYMYLYNVYIYGDDIQFVHYLLRKNFQQNSCSA